MISLRPVGRISLRFPEKPAVISVPRRSKVSLLRSIGRTSLRFPAKPSVIFVRRRFKVNSFKSAGRTSLRFSAMPSVICVLSRYKFSCWRPVGRTSLRFAAIQHSTFNIPLSPRGGPMTSSGAPKWGCSRGRAKDTCVVIAVSARRSLKGK